MTHQSADPLKEVLRAREALAEAWASIDGKLDEFLGGRCDPLNGDSAGHYGGYMEEAKELLARVEKRGFVLRAEGKTDRAPTSLEDLVTSIIDGYGDGSGFYSRDIARAILAALPAPVTIPPDILALLKKATPGEWKVNKPEHHYGMIEVVGPSLRILGFTVATDIDPAKAEHIRSDAAFICALVNWARSVAGNAAIQPEKND